MSEAMKPCPFCGDPMWQHEVSGLIRHVDSNPDNECILALKAFIDRAAWNTRHTESPLGPVADELERRAGSSELSGAMDPDPRGRAYSAGVASALREAAALVRQSSPATAREVEELRAEVERLRQALGVARQEIQSIGCDPDDIDHALRKINIAIIPARETLAQYREADNGR